MSKSQGYELIGIAWLALAASDGLSDVGTILYGLASVIGFARAYLTLGDSA